MRILESILDGLGEWFNKKVLMLCEWGIGMSTSAANGFWDVPLINSFISFIQWVSVGMVAAATVMLMADIMEEAGKERHIEWSMIFTNFFKGVGFALVAPTAGKYALLISSQMANLLNLSEALTSKTNVMLQNPIWLLLVTIIACLIFAFMSLSRFGIMFVQILSTPLYISDIVRVETAAMGSWIRQTVAIALTYLFQTILFYLGAFFMTMQTQPFLGLACWLAMPQVSKILQKYGMSTGVTGVVSSAASAAQTGLYLMSRA
jgi:hypothetical protein